MARSGYIGYEWARANSIPKTVDNAIDSAAALYIPVSAVGADSGAQITIKKWAGYLLMEAGSHLLFFIRMLKVA